MIEELANKAMELGRQHDLSDCHYGPPHWDGEFKAEPCEYYYFLAGLAEAISDCRCVELGTHWGGSARAMAKTAESVVTVDVTNLNTESQWPKNIHRITGDCMTSEVLEKVLEHGIETDLLYVDANKRDLLGIFFLYVEALRPRYVAIDDIMIDSFMETSWRVIARYHAAVDVSVISNRLDSGFGLVCPVY